MGVVAFCHETVLPASTWAGFQSGVALQQGVAQDVRAAETNARKSRKPKPNCGEHRLCHVART